MSRSLRARHRSLCRKLPLWMLVAFSCACREQASHRIETKTPAPKRTTVGHLNSRVGRSEQPPQVSEKNSEKIESLRAAYRNDPLTALRQYLTLLPELGDEWEAAALAIFSSSLNMDPSGFFGLLESLDEPRGRRLLTNWALKDLATRDPQLASRMLASFAKPLVDPATLEVIALNYYRLSPSGFLADLPAMQRRQAVRATAFNVLLEMQGQGTKGEFPSAFFVGNNANDESLVGELVNHGGGPKSSKQFTVWLEQLDETGMSSISPEVCEAFAAASGKEAKQIWTDARETFSEEEKAGLLKGIAKSDPAEACRLAAEQFRGKGPFPELLNGWLEANSMEASAWVTKDCSADMKEDANAAVADWLEAKGDVAAAKEWRSAARK